MCVSCNSMRKQRQLCSLQEDGEQDNGQRLHPGAVHSGQREKAWLLVFARRVCLIVPCWDGIRFALGNARTLQPSPSCPYTCGMESGPYIGRATERHARPLSRHFAPSEGPALGSFLCHSSCVHEVGETGSGRTTDDEFLSMQSLSLSCSSWPLPAASRNSTGLDSLSYAGISARCVLSSPSTGSCASTLQTALITAV